ncbi:MAG: DNA-directed RNA polymerase subunit H [Candidatus Kariarchaeaceae archaeon]
MSSNQRLTEDEIERYKRGITDILKRRGYTVSSYEETEKSLDIYAVSDKTSEKMIVRIPMKDVVGISFVREVNETIEKEGLGSAVLVSRRRFTHYAKKEAEKSGIEILSSSHPIFDLFKHDLVPLHEILSAEEIKEMTEKYSIGVRDLPKIFENDPAIKTIHALPGDVVKIYRSSVFAEESITYRLVVP